MPTSPAAILSLYDMESVHVWWAAWKKRKKRARDRKLIHFTDVGCSWGQQVIMSSSHKWSLCPATLLLSFFSHTQFCKALFTNCSTNRVKVCVLTNPALFTNLHPFLYKLNIIKPALHFTSFCESLYGKYITLPSVLLWPIWRSGHKSKGVQGYGYSELFY